MSAFPRYTSIKVERASPPVMGGAMQSWSQTGKGQHRATMQQGRIWFEQYSIFNTISIEGRAFLSQLNYFWRNGIQFTIDHPLYATKFGGGTGTPLVNGGGQTGENLSIDGLTGSNPVLRAGDIIRVNGVQPVLDVIEDAPNIAAGAATIKVSPPIYPGSSPLDNAVITWTGVLFNAFLYSEPPMPDAAHGGWLAGMRLAFREAI